MVVITQTVFSCWSRVFSDNMLEIGTGIALFFFLFSLLEIQETVCSR